MPNNTYAIYRIFILLYLAIVKRTSSKLFNICLLKVEEQCLLFPCNKQQIKKGTINGKSKTAAQNMGTLDKVREMTTHITYFDQITIDTTPLPNR